MSTKNGLSGSPPFSNPLYGKSSYDKLDEDVFEQEMNTYPLSNMDSAEGHIATHQDVSPLLDNIHLSESSGGISDQTLQPKSKLQGLRTNGARFLRSKVGMAIIIVLLILIVSVVIVAYFSAHLTDTSGSKANKAQKQTANTSSVTKSPKVTKTTTTKILTTKLPPLSTQKPTDTKIITPVFSAAVADALTCDFEGNSYCEYTNETTPAYRINWVAFNGSTPSSKTGPTGDHTLGLTGTYIYIEASRNNKKRARLVSPNVTVNSSQCLVFYYHMYGYSMGMMTLKIRLPNNTVKDVWSQKFDHGDRWLQAMINLPFGQYSLLFDGLVGSGFKSDMAIDDIAVLPGLCMLDVSDLPADCNFEDDWCNYQQDHYTDKLKKKKVPTAILR